jgi:hypothetical protein
MSQTIADESIVLPYIELISKWVKDQRIFYNHLDHQNLIGCLQLTYMIPTCCTKTSLNILATELFSHLIQFLFEKPCKIPIDFFGDCWKKLPNHQESVSCDRIVQTVLVVVNSQKKDFSSKEIQDLSQFVTGVPSQFSQIASTTLKT